MKYNLMEVISAILSLFNNPIGITISVVALFIGILMCLYGNTKSRIICVCGLLVLSIFSVLACIAGNSPDYLALPILALPLFIITSVIFLVFELAKLFIGKKHT